MIDKYGNYFCQKFYKLLELSDKIRFLSRFQTSIAVIGNDKIGTHALQHIICSLCHRQEKDVLIKYIVESFYKLVWENPGVHVIEKLLLCYEEEILQPLYDIILSNFYEFANDSNTLCLVTIFLNCHYQIKKVIANCTFEHTKKRIFDLITKDAVNLIKQNHGNYAIQQCIEVLI